MRAPGPGKVHIQVEIRDEPDLRALGKRIKAHADGKMIRREMTRAMRAELRPIVRAVKAAYGGGRKLRPALAHATRGQVKTTGSGAGARVLVDGRKMPSGMGKLPAYREGLGTWRHPVYGHDVWVTQSPVPVFYETVQPFVPQVTQRFDQIAAEVERKLEGA